MIRERSAGAIVFHKGGFEIEYLVLHYPAGHWDFPKGNIEKGEKEEETIIREIREETGIDSVEPIAGFSRKIEYHYRRPEGLVAKTVTFKLAKAAVKTVKLSYEHQGYAWLDYEKALERVTFENSKTVLREAKSYLEKDRIIQNSPSLDKFLGKQPRPSV